MKEYKRGWIIRCGGIILAIMLQGCNLFAQQAYQTAIGLRLGGTSGFTIKHVYQPSMAFEGIVGGFPNGFSLTGLIEKQMPAFHEEGFKWYYGGGGHVAVYNGRTMYYNRFGREVDYRNRNDIGFGVNGVVGLEYKMPDDIPIIFSVDLKPFIEFTTYGNLGVAMDPSVGIKFIVR